VAQDTFSHSHALGIEAMLGGPDHMAARVGTCANASLVAAQILRVRETSPETWARTGRVQMASAFLASLTSGTWINVGEAEACATGMYVYASGGLGHWDDEVIEYISGSREEAWRVREWLGEVDVSGGGRRVATVSRYLVDRYGFEPGEFGIAEHVPYSMCQRNYNRIIHCGLPINVPLADPIAFRCRPLLRPHGLSSYQCSPLSPQPAVQYVPTSCPRSE